MTLEEITTALKSAINGDYGIRINTEGLNKEYLELAETINKAVESLTEAKKNGESMSLMFYQNPLPMVLIDRDFKPVDMNLSYEKMMGKSKAELFNTSVNDYSVRLIKGDTTDKLFSSGRDTKCELEFTYKDGRALIAEQYGVPLKDNSGNIQNALFIFNDITKERKEEENNKKQLLKIKDLQKRSEVIVQQNPMPIILADKKFNIKVVNEAYINLSGIEREKLLSMSLRDFELLDTKGQGLKYVFETKKRSYAEVTVRFSKGDAILEQYGIPVLDHNNEISDILIVYNDITETRKQHEEIENLMNDARARALALEESIDEVAEGMTELRAGNFTYEIPVKDNDPLILLKENYNAAVVENRKLFRGALTAVTEIENSMEDALNGTTDIAKASEQVAVNSQSAAEVSNRLFLEIDGITHAISDLSASNEEIASTSQEILDQSNSVSKKGNEARDIGHEATEKMNSVAKITKESVLEIEELNTQLHEINTVVKMITEITNQINMLALNAAIEAARAGEHGRGFAVVAGEVKNLAGEARSATEKIDYVIDSIQKRSEETVSSIKSANAEVISGVSSVNLTIESLNGIVEGSNQVSLNMSEIVKAIEDQANITTRIVADAEKGNNLTQKSQTEIEELAALSEETNASVEEINSAINEVTDLAQELEKSLSHLKV
ncbi:PAS domain S-box protein [Methanoplanus sp. FWC-SCC4]|uniref:PAS domain S-box protein n=1 Tax=Methanochimaera problematica TaxID=2609417 RepID=A0AA97FEY1_9EURY|nr:PAS domain-containing methyl-accepting chemotaxis protein [Methanoplanus sp. FWC-SCC4]WOF17043.1 PAS domain S-box protein [Methanoplanus sp. FWC-SCC4]